LQHASSLDAVFARLQGRVATFASGTIIGAGVVYLQTGQVREALLACVLGPPAVAGGKVLAEWVKLLEPPKRWQRPRGEGTEPAQDSSGLATVVAAWLQSRHRDPN
jgi:hypothetical protein